ncbi:MAG: hypothetical protein JO208_08125 [Alphaproteobacteria bacterium]|nr:hypothetical protein [Alphaproteobacteria bacterium]
MMAFTQAWKPREARNRCRSMHGDFDCFTQPGFWIALGVLAALEAIGAAVIIHASF